MTSRSTGAFATALARTFFPSADEQASLLAAFAVFATAFIVRPVGALLLGRLGDRRGRCQVLAAAIILMSAMSHRTRALDPDVLTAEVAGFLDDVPVAETTGAKLSRLLGAFLEAEVLPQAEAGTSRGDHPGRVKTPQLGKLQYP